MHLMPSTKRTYRRHLKAKSKAPYFRPDRPTPSALTHPSPSSITSLANTSNAHHNENLPPWHHIPDPIPPPSLSFSLANTSDAHRRENLPPTFEGEVQGTISDLVATYFNDDPDNDVWDMYMHQEPEMQPYIDSV